MLNVVRACQVLRFGSANAARGVVGTTFKSSRKRDDPKILEGEPVAETSKCTGPITTALLSRAYYIDLKLSHLHLSLHQCDTSELRRYRPHRISCVVQ